MNNMELAWTLIQAPKTAFAQLAEKPRFVFPLVVLGVGMGVAFLWYYLTVDYAWLMDHITAMNPMMPKMSEADRARVEGVQGMMRTVVIASSSIGAVIGVVITSVIMAVYYLIAGKITNVQKNFDQWLALAAWAPLPQVINILSLFALLATSSTNQIGNEEMFPLSLNELFFHLDFKQKGSTLLASVTVIHFWIWSLAVIGVRVYSGRSWLFSIVFALLPATVFYAGWTALALLW